MTAGNGTRRVRVGILSSIGNLDPREAIDNISGLILGQIFETPYAMTAGESTVRPVLFSEPLRNDGALQYSARVREGIRFSDGTLLTADIVARSMRGAKALATKGRVSVQGDRVVFTLNVANPRFDLTLTQGNCAVVLEKDGQLLGTGPFMFEPRASLRTLQSSPTITLVRNSHYERTASLDEVNFVVCPADDDGTPNQLIDAFRRGELDVTNALTMSDMTRHRLTSLHPSLQPGNSTGILFFNTQRRALADPAVRRALASA